MANTYIFISSLTAGGGGSATFDFTSIPATYTDLHLVVSGRNSSVGNDSRFSVQFNGSSSNLSQRRLYENAGGAAVSDAPASAIQPTAVNQNNYVANTFASAEIYIPNYAGNNYKSISINAVTSDNDNANYAMLLAGLWSDTSAINRITLTPLSSGSFAQYSTAYLYGISNA